MPLVERTPNHVPILVYNAPVDEKTKELRKRFKIDEETGYPEHYNWRPLARLGPEFSAKEPFEKLGAYNPDHYINYRLTLSGFGILGMGALHWWLNYLEGKRFYAKLPRFIASSAFAVWLVDWGLDKTLKRQALRNHIILDYIDQHPERFDKMRRPKLREVLFYNVPCR